MKHWWAILLLFTGCATQPFHEDQAYWDSPQGQAEIEREGNTILRLREQIRDNQER